MLMDDCSQLDLELFQTRRQIEARQLQAPEGYDLTLSPNSEHSVPGTPALKNTTGTLRSKFDKSQYIII
jgi:hypothetical protein